MSRTAQEIFDAVVTHLFTQKAQSADDLTCLYRDSEGRRCPAGIFLADEDAVKHNSRVAGDLDVVRAMGFDSVYASSGARISLIMDLQRVHDDEDGDLATVGLLTSWDNRLRKVAREHGLDTTHLWQMVSANSHEDL
jgi:hypothetical protein